MARTLYLNDGSTELIFGNESDTLQKIIYERLGRDCEALYEEVVSEVECPAGDDYENIADGYLSMLQDTLESLDTALTDMDKPRLNKAQLRSHLQAVRDNLYKNL